MSAIGYTRTSTDLQHTRPEDDQRRITAACEAFGYELLDVLRDEGVSGKTPLAEREQGARVQRLLDARNGDREADVLVVTNLDRLTRSACEGMDLIEQLLPRGRREPVQLVSLDDHIDLTGAAGRMFVKLRLVFAEFEREQTAERTSNALQHKRRTGQVFSRELYGWARDDMRLVPVPEEQAVLAQMQRPRNEGRSDTEIARALNADGVPTKRNGSTPTTVYRILRTGEDIAS